MPPAVKKIYFFLHRNLCIMKYGSITNQLRRVHHWNEKNILETKRNMYKLHYRDSCMRIVVFSYVIVVFSYGNVYAKM